MSTKKLQAFYKSRQWENFVEQLRLERTAEDGTLICEQCGQPILKKYDCIAHHVEELTDINVDDYNIALNPLNIALVHFRCHNELHKRFGYSAPREPQHVYIVYGSPCAGKAEWVKGIAEPSDIILNIDKLWAAIRADTCGQYEKPNELKQNVFALRDTIIDMIKVRRGRWNNAYIIGGYPLEGERNRLAEYVGADKIIFVDTAKEICLLKAKVISAEMEKFVADWFDRYTPPVAL